MREEKEYRWKRDGEEIDNQRIVYWCVHRGTISSSKTS